jgi:hypoxanthine phosphoribosyltransferase
MNIKVLDKEFKLSIPSSVIQKAVSGIADRLNHDLVGKDVVFVGILNGSFMFAGDLFKLLTVPCTITFVKVASYEGTSSSGKIQQLIGFNEELKGKTVIILEDIVDTGHTLVNIISQLKSYQPEEILVVTCLFKPDAYKEQARIDYIGLEIPNNFIIGYGLDYNGFARNYADIYELV